MEYIECFSNILYATSSPGFPISNINTENIQTCINLEAVTFWKCIFHLGHRELMLCKVVKRESTTFPLKP